MSYLTCRLSVTAVKPGRAACLTAALALCSLVLASVPMPLATYSVICMQGLPATWFRMHISVQYLAVIVVIISIIIIFVSAGWDNVSSNELYLPHRYIGMVVAGEHGVTCTAMHAYFWQCPCLHFTYSLCL